VAQTPRKRRNLSPAGPIVLHAKVWESFGFAQDKIRFPSIALRFAQGFGSRLQSPLISASFTPARRLKLPA